MAGLPTVCTDVGSAGEVVQHERTGFVVAPSGLTSAVSTLAAHAELRASLGAAARESALNRFSPEGLVDAHIALYERVIDARKRNR